METQPIKRIDRPYLIAGVDPGKTGAIAFLYFDGGASVVDIPMKASGEPDWKEIHRLLLLVDLVFIENQWASGQSGFLHTVLPLARMAGGFETVAALVGARSVLIPSTVWKKFQGIHGEGGKAASLQQALKKFPWFAEWMTPKARAHNRAEALLIADYGQHVYYEMHAMSPGFKAGLSDQHSPPWEWEVGVPPGGADEE